MIVKLSVGIPRLPDRVDANMVVGKEKTKTVATIKRTGRSFVFILLVASEIEPAC